GWALVEGAVELELMFRPILRFGCRHLISAVARRHVVHDCGRFTERWGWLVPSGVGARSRRGLRRPERGGWSAAFNLIKQVVEIALHLGEEGLAFLQLVHHRDYFPRAPIGPIVLTEL